MQGHTTRKSGDGVVQLTHVVIHLGLNVLLTLSCWQLWQCQIVEGL